VSSRDDSERGGDDDEAGIEAGDEGEREVEGGVGEDVADLVEHGAEAGFLVVFAGEHAVDGVEGHAHKQEGGENEESGQRAVGKRAIQAPTATERSAAATVTWLAVTPAAKRARVIGRRRFWNAGLMS
jgi:hypothetical protein